MSRYITSSLEENISILKSAFESCSDIIFHRTKVSNQPGCLVYLSEMVDNRLLIDIEKGLSSYLVHQAREETLTDFQTSIEKILSGYTLLIVDGTEHIVVFRSTRVTGRSVMEPSTEPSVRGPKEGFVEDIHTNLSLIRQKIRTPSLKVENLTLGKQTNTQISLVYIKGVADEGVIKEVHQRLSRIELNGILDSHYIESMIKDSPKSPFPTVFSTERPDRVCGGLLDGKVAILTDGTPYALTIPAIFVEFLHSNEDYYQGALISTALRWVRFLGLFIALILPAFYVAMITIHQDLLQSPFLIRIAANREALPYPALLEALFMLLTFELIREAGLRMPKWFGGGLVPILGLVIIAMLTVHAGIVGPVMAVVISVTALISFILPNYAFQQIIRYLGIILLLLAGFFGFMGILVGLMFGLAHLVSLHSFGVPYFSPVSPARKEGWKDGFIRAPWWAMETRTPDIGADRAERFGENNAANPPDTKEEKK